MKGILIKQPWASQLVKGAMKTFTKGQGASYRGTVIVCATKIPANEEGEKKEYPKGMAVGTVDIEDVKRLPSGFRFTVTNPKEWATPKRFIYNRSRQWIRNVEFEE